MRYFVEVMYNGTHFHGSQVQGALNTVQGALNKALSTLLRQPVETFGASRTDEGVHALCNFYHFDWEFPLHPQLKYKLNALLPFALSVKHIYKSERAEANARFDAISRRYRYKLYHTKNPFLYQYGYYYPYPVNIEQLHQSAKTLFEYTDFETFSKRNTQSYTFNCKIIQSYWEQHEDELHYVVEANRFLRGMVRALVGTQLKVSRGKYSIADFRNIIEQKDCSNADFSVPGHGLYLEAVNYPNDFLTLIQ